MLETPMTEAAFNCLLRYPQLIPGALKHCGVTPTHRLYEDLKSDCQFVFVTAYCQCLTPPVAPQFYDWRNVLGYISRALRWHIQKCCRAQRRQAFHTGGPFLLGVQQPAPDAYQAIQTSSFCQALLRQCHDEELRFIRLRLLGLNMYQVAEKMGCSPRKVYYIRQGLQERVKRLDRLAS